MADNQLFDMRDQLTIGVTWEDALHAYFRARGNIVMPTPDRDVQTNGIDSIVISPRTKRSQTFEYKTDTRARDTGNCFLESEAVRYDPSVGRDPVRGWVHTTCANYVAYCAVGVALLIIPVRELREIYPSWSRRYRELSLKNFNPNIRETYTTRGVCVPLPVVQTICLYVEPWSALLDIQEFETLDS